jgi:hypothetical protein
MRQGRLVLWGRDYGQAMTFVVAGIFKELVTVLVSHAVFGDTFGPANVAGLVVVVAGVALYNVHKYRTVVLYAPPLPTHREIHTYTHTYTHTHTHTHTDIPTHLAPSRRFRVRAP